jgi:hypothetical protein
MTWSTRLRGCVTNPFEAQGLRQVVAATKAKYRAAEKRAAKAPMVPTPAEKKMADQYEQVRHYYRWKRSLIRTQLMGSQKDQWKTLTRLLRTMTIEDSGNLIGYVQNAQWIHELDVEAKHVLLSVVASAIVRLRIINGYDPFDDGIPGEGPTAFIAIRDMLTMRTSRQKL